MKKLWICLTGLLIVTACSTAEKSPSEIPANTSTVTTTDEAADIQRAKKETLDSINMATIRQRTIDSMNDVAAQQIIKRRHPVSYPVRSVAPTASHPVNTVPATAPSNQQVSSSANTPAATAASPAAEKKKGLSNGVKGGLIGLGTGAAAGAIIDGNNRGEGAIIGGVVGAVGGAFSGALIDRHKRKQAAAQAKRDSIHQDSINRANNR